MNLWRIFRAIKLSSAVLILTGCSGLFFFPEKDFVLTPDKLKLVYEDVQFASLDGTRLHGWFLPAAGEAKGTVVFYHGNAENVSTHIGAVYWLPPHGYNVFIFDYRGYGRSMGDEDIPGVNLDGQAALAYIGQRQDIDSGRVVVFGQSLGAAIALYSVATSQVPVKAVVVESAFPRYRTIFKEKLASFFLTWPLQWPLSYTVSDQYSPVNYLDIIKGMPLLVIHGDTDPIVPDHHGRALYAAAGGDKELWIIEGGGHTSAFGRFREIYRPRLLDYLDRKLGPVTPDT